MTFAFSDKISVAKSVLIEELGNESVLLNLNSLVYFSQDDITTRMFNVLTESESIEKAYQTLLQEYEVEPELLKQDLLNLIEELVEHELVEVEELLVEVNK